jgi:hypothetical protein
MLSLVRALGHKDIKDSIIEDDLEESDQQAVFFDLYNRAMIVYTGSSVMWIHASIIAFSFVTIWSMTRTHNLETRNILHAYSDELYCIGCSCLFGLAGGLVSWIFLPMRWYNGGILIALLLFVPSIVLGRMYGQGKVASMPHSSPIMRMIGCIMSYLTLAVPLILLQLNSAFIFCLWSLAMSCSMWVYYFGKGLESRLILFFLSSPKQLDSCLQQVPPISPLPSFLTAEFMYSLSLIPMMLVYHRMGHTLLEVLIPLLGKSGTVVPADLVVSLVLALLLSTYLGLLTVHEVKTKVSNSRLWKVILLIVFSHWCVANWGISYGIHHPKRLWIYNVERRYQYKSGSPSPKIPNLGISDFPREHKITTKNGKTYESVGDRGLYVLGFDTQGLKPIEPFITDFANDNALGNHPFQVYQNLARCNVDNGECYRLFPWYFPVADALRDAVYIPISAPQNISNSQNFEMLINEHNIDDGKRILEIELLGPSHINLVLQETFPGKQVSRWYLNESPQESRDNDLKVESIVEKLTKPDPMRSEGIYIMEIGFGLCSAMRQPCKKTIWLELIGREPLHVVSYGHYVDQLSDETISKFIDCLPTWSKGAEWTKFPSILIAETA